MLLTKFTLFDPCQFIIINLNTGLANIYIWRLHEN